MRKDEIEQKLKSATEQVTPEVLQHILNHCQNYVDKDGVIPMKQTNHRKTIFSLVAVAATLILTTIIGTSHYRTAQQKVETVVGFDVNPSVELTLNSRDKVVGIDPINADGKQIVSDMNLKGTDVNVAVNALLGSMIQNGFISEAQNSVLVSVDNKNQKKATEIKDKIQKDVENTLHQNNITPAVISQNITKDPSIADFANQYDISYGKAELVQKILALNPKLKAENLVGLKINDLNLIIHENQMTLPNTDSMGTVSNSAKLDKAAATQIALAHFGIGADAAQNIDTELDSENGALVYEVEFTYQSMEYSCHIDPMNGQVINSKTKPEDAEESETDTDNEVDDPDDPDDPDDDTDTDTDDVAGQDTQDDDTDDNSDDTDDSDDGAITKDDDDEDDENHHQSSQTVSSETDEDDDEDND